MAEKPNIGQNIGDAPFSSFAEAMHAIPTRK